MYRCRAYRQEDGPFLREMLFEAVFWSRTEENRPSLEEGLSYDYTRHILRGFGLREGDLAAIAEVDGKRAGAAFLRYWNDDTNIRGYLSEEMPVLVIGVEASYRRQGIGSALMDAIKSMALEKGIAQISLCVTKTNIAYQLYVKSDFQIVEAIESSYNMLWKA